MTLLRDQVESILRQALSARVGIQLHILEESPGTNTPAFRVKSTLYRFRKEIGDAEFMALQIRYSPRDPDHRIWIIKREINFPIPGTESQS